MSRRSAKIIVTVLMLASIVVLGFSALGNIRKNGEQNPTTGTSAGSSATSGETSMAETTVTTAPVQTLQSLPVRITDPEPTPPIGLRRWPAESSLPIIREPDLAAYVGQPADAKSLQGITVILDPGHGGQDSGTIYPDKSQSPEIMEKDIVLEVAFKIRTLLENLGAKVVMTREADEWHSIYSRIAMAGRHTAERLITELPAKGYRSDPIDDLLPKLDEMIRINSDAENSGGRGILKGIGLNAEGRLLLDTEGQFPDTLFISLHCNSLASDQRVRGMQVYYLTNEANYRKENRDCQYVDSMQNQPAYMMYDDIGRTELATLLRDNILAQLPELKFGGESDLLLENYAVLRETNLVNALVEMGFVTNEKDRQLLLDPAGQQKIAQAIADAVFLYYCG